MKSFPWKLTLGIICVFLAGMASSVLIIGILAAKGSKDPNVGKERLLRTMTRALDLDETQQQDVEVVVDDIVVDTRTEVAQVINEHSPRILEVLRPEPHKKFEKFLGRVENHLHIDLKTNVDGDAITSASDPSPPTQGS